MLLRNTWLLIFFTLSVTAHSQQWGKTSVQHGRGIYSIVIRNPHDISISGGSDYSASIEGIYNSNDDGLNWNENPADTFSFCVRSIAFADSLHGFGSGFFGNYVHTSDGGVTWPRDTLPISRNFFKALYTSPTKAFLVGGEELGSNLQTILRSTDGATTWTVVRDVAGPVLRSICFTDSLHGCAVGDTGTILRTIDGGTTWTSVTAPIQVNFNSITFINSDTGYIVGGFQGSAASHAILRTTDGSSTWTILQNQPGSWYRDISFLNPDTGYIVGDSATFLQSVDGGQTWSAQTVTSAIGSESFTSVRFYSSGFGIIGATWEEGLFVYSGTAVPIVHTGNVIFGVSNSQPDINLTGYVNTNGTVDNIAYLLARDSILSPQYLTPYPQAMNSSTLTFAEYDITNLLSPGTYYFTCVATNTNGSYYGDTVRFVIPDSAAVLTALPYTNTGATSLTLNGQIRWLPVSSSVYFEYSIRGDTVVHSVAATPSAISDSLSHSISANIANLVSGAQYIYRIKALSGNEILYSDYLYFVLDTSIILTPLPASDVTDTSATLQGQVQNVSPSYNIWFEYMPAGDTIPTTVPAIPNTVTDDLPHAISVPVTGLIPDTTYLYRIKVGVDPYFSIYSRYGSFSTVHSHGLAIYPNPTNSILNIELIQPQYAEPQCVIQIIDALGTIVSSFPSPLMINKFAIDISHLPVGIYIISAGNPNTSKFISKKFIRY